MQVKPYNPNLNIFKRHNAPEMKASDTTALALNRKNVSFGINPSGSGSLAKTIINLKNKDYLSGTGLLAHMFGWLSSTKVVKESVDLLKDRNYQRHIQAFVSILLSGFYMRDTMKSKKIEQEQKMPLAINQGITCLLSTIGAYSLDNYLDKKLDNLTEIFHIASISDKKVQKKFLAYKNNPQYADRLRAKAKSSEKVAKLVETLEDKFDFTTKIRSNLEKMVKKGDADGAVKSVVRKIKEIPLDTVDKAAAAKKLFMAELPNSKHLQKIFNKQSFDNAIKMISNDEKLSTKMQGFKVAKSLMVFAMIYRFVAPVIATPLANKMSKKLEDKKKASK